MTSAPSRPRSWLPILFILLALGGFLRLLDLNDPPLDFHATRQLRNALVARDIYYHLQSQVEPSTLALTESFRRSVGQYEPPVIESLAAIAYLLVGGETPAVPRLLQTLFWLLAGLTLFDLGRRAASPWAALIGLAYYLVLPFSVQASRSFQPDPLMTSAFAAGMYFLYRWTEQPTTKSWRWAILAGLFLGLAVLVKIVIAFLVGGAAAAAVLCTLGRRFWKSPQVWAMSGLMILPAFGYYVLGHAGRSGEYFFSWTVALIALIASPTFYARWLGFLGSLFGLTALFIGLAGTLLATPRLRWLLLGAWLGYLLYGLTLPFQMYTHSYYHLQIVPLIALGLIPPAQAFVEQLGLQARGWQILFTGLILSLVGYQAWAARSILLAEDFRHEPVFWSQVSESIPRETNVIALTQDYGYRLMYYGWRKVSLWPLSTELSQVRSGGKDAAAGFTELTAGKDYFLVTAFGQLDKQPELKDILKGYPIAAQGDGFVLYNLKP